MITGERVVEVGRSWLGTRYQHQACVKGVACDCIGYIAGVAAELGIPEAQRWLDDPRRKSYGPQPIPEVLLGAVSDYLDPGKMPPHLGDVLVLRWKRTRHPMHFAIVSNEQPLYMMHAFANIGRVVEHRVSEEWFNCIDRVCGYRGIA